MLPQLSIVNILGVSRAGLGVQLMVARYRPYE